MRFQRKTALVSLSCTLMAVAAGSALAAEVWVADLQIDDGLALQTLQVVAPDEASCLEAVASYRDVVAIAPCRPVASSAIVDDNDYGRGRRNPGTVQPDPGSGSSSGGTAAGAGRGLGSGVGNIAGGH